LNRRRFPLHLLERYARGGADVRRSFGPFGQELCELRGGWGGSHLACSHTHGIESILNASNNVVLLWCPEGL
jgi:hypothetical protein